MSKTNLNYLIDTTDHTTPHGTKICRSTYFFSFFFIFFFSLFLFHLFLFPFSISSSLFLFYLFLFPLSITSSLFLFVCFLLFYLFFSFFFPGLSRLKAKKQHGSSDRKNQGKNAEFAKNSLLTRRIIGGIKAFSLSFVVLGLIFHFQFRLSLLFFHFSFFFDDLIIFIEIICERKKNNEKIIRINIIRQKYKKTKYSRRYRSYGILKLLSLRGCFSKF